MAAKQTASSADLLPKPSLGQYVFTEKLGSGTYATVYKAYRKNGLREVVAIKCVLKSSLNKASTENLLTEIELLKNLKHEHIVMLKDFQWDSSYIYLIMEFCSGGDLSRFIRSKRALPEHVVKRFLQQIASAMKYLWDNNVAHMDLKPQNILLTAGSSPQIKLADFGFAKHLYEGDNLHVMRGSPLYMAPEIICQGTYDNRVDLWSIGVILFECLFGKAPFASKTFKELGAKIWAERPVEIPSGFDLSDNAKDLTLRLLQRQPSDRITFEEFFAHPFVDLQHLPSKHSLPAAIHLIEDAVRKDQAGDYKAAIRLYCDSLAYFVAAIHHEKNPNKKDVLNAKVREYMKRAETLKQIMKDGLHSSLSGSEEAEDRTCGNASSAMPKQNRSKTDSNSSKVARSHSDNGSQCPNNLNKKSESEEGAPYLRSESLESLMNMCEDCQELVAVLKLIKAAEVEELAENFTKCLHHYEVALGAALKLLPKEPKGKRKDLLSSQVKKWMEKAEKIKAFLDIQNLNTNAEEEDSEGFFLTQSKQCSIQ